MGRLLFDPGFDLPEQALDLLVQGSPSVDTEDGGDIVSIDSRRGVSRGRSVNPRHWQDLIASSHLFFEQQPGLQVPELQYFLVRTGVLVGSFERAYQVSWVALGSNAFGIGATVVPGRDGQVNHCLGLFSK